MEKFKQFEVKNQKIIFGGEHIVTAVVSTSGESKKDDIYDSLTDRWIYFE